MTESEALKLSRVQLLTRSAQLSQCRVCGADKLKYDEATAVIERMIKEREDAVRTRTEEPR